MVEVVAKKWGGERGEMLNAKYLMITTNVCIPNVYTKARNGWVFYIFFFQPIRFAGGFGLVYPLFMLEVVPALLLLG